MIMPRTEDGTLQEMAKVYLFGSDMVWCLDGLLRRIKAEKGYIELKEFDHCGIGIVSIGEDKSGCGILVSLNNNQVFRIKVEEVVKS